MSSGSKVKARGQSAILGPRADREARRFGQLRQRLEHAFSQPLPGIRAQTAMAPRPREGWNPGRLPPGLARASVLVLLYPLAGEPHLLLTVRAAGMRQHTGQVALPGGRLEPGESPADAALREAFEEVGVPPAAVAVLGMLTPLHVPVSRFLVDPVVGMAEQPPAFQVAETEVARVLEVPLSALLDPANVRSENRAITSEGGSMPMVVPYFAVEGEQVWGATAMILAELLEVLRTEAR